MAVCIRGGAIRYDQLTTLVWAAFFLVIGISSIPPASLQAAPPAAGKDRSAGKNLASATDGDSSAKSDAASDKGSDAPKKADKPHKDDDRGAAHNPFAHRIKAPGFGNDTVWLNTAGPLELEKLRGKFVLLDFWTYCCINCMHILPELKKLEEAYPKNLVVIGVHSAKFDGERDTKNITDAILRYEIRHPVINDSKHAIWNEYGVNTWPTALLIDPEGYAVDIRTGEFEAEAISTLLKKTLPWYRKKGVLDETPLRFDLVQYQVTETPLRYPGKILADEASDRLFIADSNHNRVVIATLDGKLLATVGSGAIGAADGDYATASFNHPQGMALHGNLLYVADTENHLLRKIDLEHKHVSTIAGTGEQGGNPFLAAAAALRSTHRGSKLRKTAINSPWDLLIHGEDLFIAMAGPHQIWKMRLNESELGPYAGNAREDIVDGPLFPRRPFEEGFASFAQPSGLASDGQRLFVADSEGSSIRSVPMGGSGEVKTIIGTSHLENGRLFEFGDVDGEGFAPRLQHPLGLAYYRGRIYVADTYNNKIKIVDPAKASSHTLSGDGRPGTSDDPAEFDEPTGVSAAAGKLYVADTNNHLVRTIDLDHDNRVATLTIEGLKPPHVPVPETTHELPGAKQVKVDLQRLKAVDGSLRFTVALHLPDEYKINPLAPLRYRLEALAPSGPVDRQATGKSIPIEPPTSSFEIRVPLAASSGKDHIKLSLNYYYCASGAEGLCKAGSVVWDVPFELAPDASATSIPLELWAQ